MDKYVLYDGQYWYVERVTDRGMAVLSNRNNDKAIVPVTSLKKIQILG